MGYGVFSKDQEVAEHHQVCGTQPRVGMTEIVSASLNVCLFLFLLVSYQIFFRLRNNTQTLNLESSSTVLFYLAFDSVKRLRLRWRDFGSDTTFLQGGVQPGRKARRTLASHSSKCLSCPLLSSNPLPRTTLLKL